MIGKDGKVNILRHGGQIVRAHICRVKGMASSEYSDMSRMNENRKSEVLNNHRQIENDESEDDDDECINGNDNGYEVPDEGNRFFDSEREGVIPKIGKRYEVTLGDSNEKINVKILSRAGKAKGKYSNCYNFRNEGNGQESWMDFGKEVKEIRERWRMKRRL